MERKEGEGWREGGREGKQYLLGGKAEAEAPVLPVEVVAAEGEGGAVGLHHNQVLQVLCLRNEGGREGRRGEVG